MKRGKSILILCLLFLFCSLIVAKLFYLQIIKGKYFEALALGQQTSFQEQKAERGGVFFSSGEPLAITEQKIVGYILPSKIEKDNLEIAAIELADIFTTTSEEILRILEQGIAFRKEISEEKYKIISINQAEGVVGDKILTRKYPNQKMAANVLGFVNEEGQGQYGIEGYYNDILEGGSASSAVRVSPDGLSSFFDNVLGLKPTNKGAEIYLTLQKNIQYFAEKLLEQAFADWRFDKAQIIVVDPLTGKILALAVFPSFNPNEFYKESDLSVFLNAALQELFEPGSVFKPITMAGGLEEGLVEPQTEYEDTGKVELGGPAIFNFDKRIWGKQTMTDVLEESINTGAVFVEQKLGKEKFLQYVERFGFFKPTGIDLANEAYSANEGLKKGYPRDFASASFGQGIMITPLQLVKAFGVIANNGSALKPHIVDKIIFFDGQEKIMARKQEERVISESTASKLTAMLVSVVKNGAGRKAQVAGYHIAGKTGTAQVPLKTGGYDANKTIQSFIGFFPATKPRFLIFVRLDNPQQANAASSSAAPIFGELAKYILDLYQIPPDF